ncbi:MAG: bifunctional riboflavin kinase/FAD synthetase [Anaerolineae bacterium]|nr:bifunctional riboflavin kinase/FAD synthetase [Anaerolineae bacterium]
MQHVTSLAEAHPSGPTIVAVGMFDGVHRGHQHLLRRLVQTARVRGFVPAVLTFFPHPDMVLGRASGRYYLTSPQQRADLLGELGVELVVTHPFNEEMRHMRAAEFVDRLLAHLKLRELWVGPEFTLGYRREGNVSFLRAEGARKGFSLEVVDLVTNDGNGDVISSSTIRAALAEGDVAAATRRLGRPYRLEGEVVRGDGRGRTIGFPTANLDVWDEQFLPRKGVYAGWAHLNGETFMAVANIGNRPTFNGGVVTVEAHLLDFDRDIYGERLAFDVVAFLRPELKFNGVEALVAQIRQDAIEGRALLSALTTNNQ